jgi:hypothetical protein
MTFRSTACEKSTAVANVHNSNAPSAIVETLESMIIFLAFPQHETPPLNVHVVVDVYVYGPPSVIT